jgi:hypothetical protein
MPQALSPQIAAALFELHAAARVVSRHLGRGTATDRERLKLAVRKLMLLAHAGELAAEPPPPWVAMEEFRRAVTTARGVGCNGQDLVRIFNGDDHE